MDKKDFPKLSDMLEGSLKGRGEVERVHFESTPGGKEGGLWPPRIWGQPVLVDSGPLLDISNLMRVQEMLNGGFRRGDLSVMVAHHRPFREPKIDMTSFMAQCSPDPELFMERLMQQQPLVSFEGFDEEGFKESLDRMMKGLEAGDNKNFFTIDSLGEFEPGDEVTVSYQTIGGKRRKSKKDKNVSKKKKLKASRLAKGLINRI